MSTNEAPGVRTLAETRDGRVTVTITVDTQESIRELPCEGSGCPRMADVREGLQDHVQKLESALAVTTNSRESNRAKVMDQRVKIDELEAELRRYRTAHVCTENCTKDAHVAFTGRQMVNQLRDDIEVLKTGRAADHDEIVELRAERDRLLAKLKDEKSQRDANREWAERAEQRVESLKVDLALASDELAKVRAQARSLKEKLAVAHSDWQAMVGRRKAAWNRVSELEKLLATELDRNAELGVELQNHGRALTAIRDAVYAADVRQATAAEPVNPDVDVLIRAVRDIRDLVSSSPSTGTLQA